MGRLWWRIVFGERLILALPKSLRARHAVAAAKPQQNVRRKLSASSNSLNKAKLKLVKRKRKGSMPMQAT
ncbi:MAG: hypothetical protein R3Y27_07250 [Clostridia bacterium]